MANISHFTQTVNGISTTYDIHDANAVPRSGGAVMSGGILGRTVNDDEFRLDGGTGWDNGASITLVGKDNQGTIYGAPATGVVRLHVSDGSLSGDLIIYPAGSLTWNGNYLRPDTDNYCKLGAVQYRFSELYAATGTINTSDSRFKNSINDIDDKLLDAWGNIEPKQYKFNDAAEKKGEKARYHTGYLAQDIQSECEKQGVNASDYGLFCYDEWEEREEEVEEIETEKDGKKVKEKRVIQPKREKGNMYALRYEEALVVECKYLRRCIERLTARIEQLEKEQEASK